MTHCRHALLSPLGTRYGNEAKFVSKMLLSRRLASNPLGDDVEMEIEHILQSLQLVTVCIRGRAPPKLFEFIFGGLKTAIIPYGFFEELPGVISVAAGCNVVYQPLVFVAVKNVDLRPV